MQVAALVFTCSQPSVRLLRFCMRVWVHFEDARSKKRKVRMETQLCFSLVCFLLLVTHLCGQKWRDGMGSRTSHKSLAEDKLTTFIESSERISLNLFTLSANPSFTERRRGGEEESSGRRALQIA
eukprot:3939537-Rhodomonas_salina.5